MVFFIVSAMVGVRLLSHLFGEAVINLTVLFRQMSFGGNDELWWLYLTVLTTLVPTVLHASVAAATIGTAVLPRSIRTRLGEWLELDDDYTKREVAVLGTSVLFTVALVGPVVVLAWLTRVIFFESRAVGTLLAEFFEWIYLRGFEPIRWTLNLWSST